MTPTGPSAHLSWMELACKDGTPYPTIWRETRGRILGIEFEAFRRLCGDVPLTVASGFRTREWNRRVGGSTRSQHVEGRALDLETPRSLTLKQFHRLAHSHAMREDSRVYGIGYYPWGVHLDIRPAVRLAVWHGSRTDADRIT